MRGIQGGQRGTKGPTTDELTVVCDKAVQYNRERIERGYLTILFYSDFSAFRARGFVQSPCAVNGDRCPVYLALPTGSLLASRGAPVSRRHTDARAINKQECHKPKPRAQAGTRDTTYAPPRAHPGPCCLQGTLYDVLSLLFPPCFPAQFRSR